MRPGGRSTLPATNLRLVYPHEAVVERAGVEPEEEERRKQARSDARPQRRDLLVRENAAHRRAAAGEPYASSPKQRRALVRRIFSFALDRSPSRSAIFATRSPLIASGCG